MSDPSGSGVATAASPRPVVRALAVLILLLVLLLLAEAGARAFWYLAHQFPLDTRPDPALFYGRLREVRRQHPARGDSTIDVLILGGSTVSDEYGAIGPALQERLALATHRRVRVFNLAAPGHTSRDSWYKYRGLADVRFDLVVVYDGINETRLNNVPDSLFRDDYTHDAHYLLLHDVLDRHRLWPLALPYTLEVLWRAIRVRRAERAGHPIMLTRGPMDSAATAWGSRVKTAGPYRRNLEAILDLAAQRGDPVILSSFAFYVAPGYSLAAFRARTLDYADHISPLELWGRPDNVVAALTLHNEAIRAIHAARPTLPFADVAAAIPHDRQHFNDVCHVTIAGSESFADALMPAALQALGLPQPVTPARR